MHFIVKLRSANFLLNEYCIVLHCSDDDDDDNWDVTF